MGKSLKKTEPVAISPLQNTLMATYERLTSHVCIDTDFISPSILQFY